MKVPFTKMHGCGNDYIYFNCLESNKIKDPQALSIRLSDRHFGIGGDGIILILPSDVADARMRMFNADGSEGKMCGNGTRCIGKYMYDNHLIDGDSMTLETLGGIKKLEFSLKNDTVESVRVNMGPAILNPKEIPVYLNGTKVVGAPLTLDDKTYAITCVSMGNPHCVVFVDDVEHLNLPEIGPKFENNPLFPERINTEFIRVIDNHTLEMRVWERGSGETLACGTGACASVVAAVLNGYCEKNEDILIHLRGGDLIIRYTDEAVYLSGPATKVFDGFIEIE
jgi:diaminopimelate epimerase